MSEPPRVRVLLLSPRDRLLLIKYRNTQRSGADSPIWQMAGGGRDPGESVEQTAVREVFEETGISIARPGPVVWYGEDAERSGDWGIVYREHFILARAATERLDNSRWTAHELDQILALRWWSLEEIRASAERLYPPGLANLLAPILAGILPLTPLTLPRIGITS